MFTLAGLVVLALFTVYVVPYGPILSPVIISFLTLLRVPWSDVVLFTLTLLHGASSLLRQYDIKIEDTLQWLWARMTPMLLLARWPLQGCRILHEWLAQLRTTTMVREPTPFGANFDDFHELCTTVCHQTEWLMTTQDRLVEQRDSLLDRVRASRDELRQAQNELHTHVAELAAERRSHAEERGIRLASLEKLWAMMEDIRKDMNVERKALFRERRAMVEERMIWSKHSAFRSACSAEARIGGEMLPRADSAQASEDHGTEISISYHRLDANPDLSAGDQVPQLEQEQERAVSHASEAESFEHEHERAVSHTSEAESSRQKLARALNLSPEDTPSFPAAPPANASVHTTSTENVTGFDLHAEQLEISPPCSQTCQLDYTPTAVFGEMSQAFEVENTCDVQDRQSHSPSDLPPLQISHEGWPLLNPGSTLDHEPGDHIVPDLQAQVGLMATIDNLIARLQAETARAEQAEALLRQHNNFNSRREPSVTASTNMAAGLHDAQVEQEASARAYRPPTWESRASETFVDGLEGLQGQQLRKAKGPSRRMPLPWLFRRMTSSN